MEAARNGRRLHDFESLDRRCEALERECPEIAVGEYATGHPLRGLGDNDGIGRGDGLQPGSQVRCFTDNVDLARFAAGGEIADDDQTGGHADACLQG